jgi:hypothetical protein
VSDPRRNGIDEMYRGGVRVFASLIIIFGMVILITTLVNGGGPLSVGLLLGLGFVALGVARLWLTFK